MGGLSWLRFLLVRYSTNVGLKDKCSHALEDLNADLKHGFLDLPGHSCTQKPYCSERAACGQHVWPE